MSHNKLHKFSRNSILPPNPLPKASAIHLKTHGNVMKPSLRHTLFHFFLYSCISFSLMFCFFPFAPAAGRTQAGVFPRGLRRRAGSSRQPRRQQAGRGPATATPRVAGSHHGEPPAGLCPTPLGANFFTSCSASSCKHCRKVKTADRPRFTFLCL